MSLASPRKRGGGTADVSFGIAVQYSDNTTFIINETISSRDGGDCVCLEVLRIVLLSISIPTVLTAKKFGK